MYKNKNINRKSFKFNLKYLKIMSIFVNSKIKNNNNKKLLFKYIFVKYFLL